jgi:hypothetical protein
MYSTIITATVVKTRAHAEISEQLDVVRKGSEHRKTEKQREYPITNTEFPISKVRRNIRRCRPGLKLSLFSELKAPCFSPHCAFEVVLGKGYDGVSSDAVYGKVLDIGSISVRFPTS